MPRYELTPEEAHHYRNLLVDEQFEVFGEDRMADTLGHEAQDQDVEAFTNTIRTIVNEMPEPEQRYFGDIPLSAYKLRHLNRHQKRPLLLQWNPKLHHGFAPTDIDRSIASVQDLKIETKVILKPRNGLKPGKYEVSEDVYIDRNGKAKVAKSIVPLTPGGTKKLSVKNATSQEVQEAIDIISEALKVEDAENG